MIPFYCTTKNIDETDNSAQFLIDTTTYKKVKIGTVSGFTYGYIVNWGDGTVTAHTTSAIPSHTYSTDGDKTITITGRFPAISYGIYGNTTSEPVLKEILSCKLVFTGTGLTDGFRRCTLLTTIPDDMFYCSPSVTTFYNIFYGCSALTEIPAHLFDKNTQVTENGFRGIFFNCPLLTSIPAHLFDNSPLVSTDGFRSAFNLCRGITSIPADLFKYNTQVSTSGFYATFYGCSALTSIPSSLFTYNTQVSTSGFFQTFSGCSALTSIPNDLFTYNTQVSTSGFFQTFYGCSALTSIPADLFKYNQLVSDQGFLQTFSNCIGLTTMPTTVDFLGASPSNILDITSMFSGCSGITGALAEFWNLYDTSSWIKDGCYDGCYNATNYEDAIAAGFVGNAQFLIDTTTYKTVKIGTVSGFTYNYMVNWGDGTVTYHNTAAVPSHEYSTDGDKTITITGRFPAISYGIYGNTTSEPVLKEILSCKLVFTGAGLTNGFRSCSLLTDVPYDMFYCSPSVTTFYNIFSACAALTEIPEHLFDKNTQVTVNGFRGIFYGCTGITSIPADLFTYNTQVSTSGFNATFYGCTGITSIPADLFTYNTQVSTSGFTQTFYGCTGITSIPADLFKYNTQVSTSAFYSTFSGCTGLTAIPTDLFKYNTLVSNSGFFQTFYGCTQLTSIPSDLFKYNTLVDVNGFWQTFSNCIGLTTMPTTVDFLGVSPSATTNVTGMFSGCSGITGALAEFWNLYDTTSWTKSSCYTGCVNATNFAAAQAAGFAA